MSEYKNKHGLTRTIPEGVQRRIRQNAGFGCVICGLGIWEYEHLDPEYADAKEHDPEAMTLLCAQCHTKKTRGFIDKKTVLNASKNPKALKNGFSNEFFTFNDQPLKIYFGGAVFEDCRIPLQINGIPILEMYSPEEVGAPFRLSATFYDSNGLKTLRIEKNEWRALNDNWDVDTEGSVIIIREKLGKISLVIKAVPPNEIRIERIKMKFKEIDIIGNADSLKIEGNTWYGLSAYGCNVGIDYHTR